MDSVIEELWIGDSGGKVIPLDEWLQSNSANTLEWISRKEALVLQSEAQKKFGVELSAISESELPNYTVSIVATIPKGADRDALKAFLESAPSKFRIDVQLGNKWVALDGLLSEDGEYVPR